MALASSVPRVISVSAESEPKASPAVSFVGKHSTDAKSNSNVSPPADLAPEVEHLSLPTNQSIWSSMNLVLSVDAVSLYLYDDKATSEDSLDKAGIARFTLTATTLRAKSLTDGSTELELLLRSFTIKNTRAGNSKFREIIPAAQHGRNQFMLLYTVSGGAHPSSMAILTIDSPNIIFAVDPVFALLRFFTANNDEQQNKEGLQEDEAADTLVDDAAPHVSEDSQTLDFRIDLHNLSISVLVSDADPKTEALQLYIRQILLSQQGMLALTVNTLRMSLLRMDQPSESVRFLDDLDLSLWMDNRRLASQQISSIELDARPIVFRVSYRDIMLITKIVNEALELSSQSHDGQFPNNDAKQEAISSSRGRTPPTVQPSRKSSFPSVGSKKSSTSQAKVITSKEHLKITLDGIRFVLIGDMHELPMVHLKTSPLEINLKDWTGDLRGSTSIGISITFWNIMNSHWEPLLEPWTFTFTAGRDNVSGALNVLLASKDRLEVNVNTTFLELLMLSITEWRESDNMIISKTRGVGAPYKIVNNTGFSVSIWSDAGSEHPPVIKLVNGDSTDWRFDDWKTMREETSTSRHNTIGIKFEGKPWESLKNVPVDKEGEFVCSLRPKVQHISNRMLCAITVEKNVKIVTLKSTYSVCNRTLFPMEVMLLDKDGHPAYAVEKLAPGGDYALPIDAVLETRVTLRPAQGFGYKWSNALRWEDLVSRPKQNLTCSHSQPNEGPFHIHAWAKHDTKDTATSKHPRLALYLHAPIELENLLPYTLQYRVYDKQTDQNWSGFLPAEGIMPVHSISLQDLVLMNMHLEDTVFKPSAFVIINTDDAVERPLEDRISVKDPQGRSLDLQLNYVPHPDSGGAFKVQIYSPFVIVNKTQTPFGVRCGRMPRIKEAAGDMSESALKSHRAFMLSHSSRGGHEFQIRLAESYWSQNLSFDSVSAETAVVMLLERQSEMHAAVSWAEGTGKYSLTKVITLAPRFMLSNKLDYTIKYRERGTPSTEKSELEPGVRIPLFVFRQDEEKLMTFARPGLDAKWSAPINILDIGSIHFRLFQPGQANTEPDLIRADISMGDGATIHISICRETQAWPIIIENKSDHDMTFCQIDATRPTPDSDRSKPYHTRSVNRGTSVQYAWDLPSVKEKRLSLRAGSQTRTIDIMEIGVLQPFRFGHGSGSRTVALDIRAKGSTQILEISNYQEEYSLYKVKRRGTVSRQNTSGSTTSEAFEAVTEDATLLLSLKLDFDGLGISLINRHLVEVVYLTLRGLVLDYTRTDVAQALNLSCGAIQIDNQLHDAIFPVALQPTPIKKGQGTANAPPAVQASIVLLNDDAHGVLFVQYVSILLQSLTIRVDEDFVLAIIDISKLKQPLWNPPGHALIKDPEVIPEPKAAVGGQSIYFELLELQPIQLLVSFMTTQRIDAEEKIALLNPVALILRTAVAFFGNLNDAPLRLNALAIKDVRQDTADLQQRIIAHYRTEIIRQAYRIVGSADFIGNPVGLFNNISSGISDVFYEPLQGVVIHGINKDFGIGVVKGVSSLVKNTVFGVSDSVSKVTNSIGKGLSIATLDPAYEQRRRIAQRRNKPKHFIDGLVRGGGAFVSGVTSGVEGLINKPLDGAAVGGAEGFVTGVGRGLAGAVTKPFVGLMDMASTAAQGVRNTTMLFDGPARDRVRMPRCIPSDGVMVPYSSREALGQAWMKDLEQGSFRDEQYVAHIAIPQGDNVIMLTMSRILSFWSRKLRLEWDLPLRHVQGVNLEDTGISFMDKDGRDRDRFVYIAQPSSKAWFFTQIQQVVTHYNANRRIDRGSRRD